VRFALEFVLSVQVFDTGELNRAPVLHLQAVDALREVAARTDQAECDVDQAIAAGKLREVLTEDDRAIVGGESEAEQEEGFSAAGLAAVVQLVSRCQPGSRLGSVLRDPDRIGLGEQQDQVFLLRRQRWQGSVVAVPRRRK